MLDLGATLERLLTKPESERRIGPFVLVRQLGRGGFAPVWLAKETFGGETLRAAAVKIFALDEHDSSASRRIIAEASALCRVEHPNVVRFYSLAVDEDLGVLGLGMEFVAGRSVAMRLDHAGLMRPEQVIDLGLAVASALEAVHRAGIVHRDIKPANIMETDQGYKLVDFGISSTATTFPDMTWAHSNDPDCTGRVAALQSGTLGYVDPVMIAVGAPASPMSDLYALGATLFECLTGQLPASCDRKTFDEHILDGRKPPPPISTHATHASSELAAIIDKLVSPDRSQRYSSAQEVFRALERVREASAPSAHSAPIRRPFFSARAGVIVFSCILVGSNCSVFADDNSTVSPAEPVDDIASAKELNRKGLVLLDAGDYAGALSFFESSRALVRSYANTRNVALCLDALGRKKKLSPCSKRCFPIMRTNSIRTNGLSRKNALLNYAKNSHHLEKNSNVVVASHRRGCCDMYLPLM